MAELADAPDLGSGGRPCRFKSCYPHFLRGYYEENGIVLEKMYKAQDGVLKCIGKKGCGHHPHGLVTGNGVKDNSAIYNYIIENCNKVD